jgi:predicted dehydrogenase
VRHGFGVVGTGSIARVHAQAVLSLPNAELVACCDTVPERAARFAGEFGGSPYADLDAFLRHPGLEVVTVSTPSGAHLGPAVRAARAGKHIIVEKPLEITPARCDEIISAVDGAGVLCAGVFPNRFTPGPRALKEAVLQGRFGAFVLGQASVPWYRSQEYYDSSGWRGTWSLDGGGALMNQAIHSVDLLQWFMGPVESVQAYAGTLGHRRIEVEDVAVAALRFACGALGVIQASTASFPGLPPRVEVTGTRGSAALSDQDIELWRFAEAAAQDEGLAGRLREPARGASSASDPTAVDIYGHREQFRDMIEAIEVGRQPAIDAREARKAVAVIAAIYRSARIAVPVPVE